MWRSPGSRRRSAAGKQQVAFPMPGHRPVSHLGGSLADMQGVAELAATRGSRLPRGSRIARPVRRQRCSSGRSTPRLWRNSDR